MKEFSGKTKFKRILLTTVGFIFLIVAGIGILLPILPTTPFVLCAAACFGYGSPKLRTYLENTKYFGEYIRHYKEQTPISPRTRCIGVVFLWFMLAVSAFIVQNKSVWAVLFVVGLSVTAHILLIGRKKPPGK
jgi:uncharacterized membrane protein YbaN (DUF454 family)